MSVSAWFQCIGIVKPPPSACDRLQFPGGGRVPAGDERWRKLAGIKPCNAGHAVYTDSLLCRRRESHARHRGPSDPGASGFAGDTLARLADAEHQLSEYRRSLHERLDAATGELISRYREEPALALRALPLPHGERVGVA